MTYTIYGAILPTLTRSSRREFVAVRLLISRGLNHASAGGSRPFRATSSPAPHPNTRLEIARRRDDGLFVSPGRDDNERNNNRPGGQRRRLERADNVSSSVNFVVLRVRYESPNSNRSAPMNARVPAMIAGRLSPCFDHYRYATVDRPPTTRTRSPTSFVRSAGPF